MLQDLIISLQNSEYVRCYFLGAIWCYWWSGIAKNRYFVWWAKISCGICYCHIYQAAFDYSGWALKSFRFRCVSCTFLVRFISLAIFIAVCHKMFSFVCLMHIFFTYTVYIIIFVVRWLLQKLSMRWLWPSINSRVVSWWCHMTNICCSRVLMTTGLSTNGK